MKCSICEDQSFHVVNGKPLCKYCFAWGVLMGVKPLNITTKESK